MISIAISPYTSDSMDDSVSSYAMACYSFRYLLVTIIFTDSYTESCRSNSIQRLPFLWLSLGRANFFNRFVCNFLTNGVRNICVDSTSHVHVNGMYTCQYVTHITSSNGC
eukprot:145442_1